MNSAPASAATEADHAFTARVDAMRCHSTASLRSMVADARREQQRWYLEELAATRVLDERQALDARPDVSVSARTARTNRELARSLESLPEVAAAAWSGDLSKDQLIPVAEVATTATDDEWAERGSCIAPVDLARAARAGRVVTAADAVARREAQYVRSWRDADQGMVFGRWALPDVDGVLVERVLDQMAEQMRPAKGMAWDSLAHRKADAFVELCTTYAGVTTTKRAKALIVVHTNADRTGGEVDGIPIASETVQEMLVEARVVELARRDCHCRYPGCERTRGLQHHHLVPVTWGGHTSRRFVVRLCPEHHHRMEPHGRERLVGEPDLLDGLRLITTGTRAQAGPAP